MAVGVVRQRDLVVSTDNRPKYADQPHRLQPRINYKRLIESRRWSKKYKRLIERKKIDSDL